MYSLTSFKLLRDIRRSRLITSFPSLVRTYYAYFLHTVHSSKMIAPGVPLRNNWLSIANHRQQTLTNLYSLLKKQSINQMVSLGTFCQLFSQMDFLKLVFQLIESLSTSSLTLGKFIDFLRGKFRDCDFINYLDTLAYAYGDDRPLHFHMFIRIFRTEGAKEKLFNLIDTNRVGLLSVTQVMDFIADTTYQKRSCDLNCLNLDYVDKYFRDLLKDGTRELTREEFKKMIPCKNPYFAERAFRIFDKDGSGRVSIVEFRQTLDEFCSRSTEDKVRYLFQIYDSNGDGLIKLNELRAVLQACSDENQLTFSDEQLNQLAIALYQDAANQSDVDNKGICYEQLLDQIERHPGLLENLSISLEQFMLPSVSGGNIVKYNLISSITNQFASMQSYAKNNVSLIVLVMLYLVVNVVVFVLHAFQYYDYPFAYILARASGQALNFNCSFIAVLMLRRTITLLWAHGIAKYLPLDKHVFFHSVCGGIIVFFTIVHVVAHMTNSSISVKIIDSNHLVEWFFTAKSGRYGLIAGVANVTGWPLLIILTVMCICALPVVRKNGYFEVFYWTHLLYVPFWIILILHGSHFWIWFLLPGLIFLIEKGSSWFNKIKTFISSTELLPSKVIQLVIKKPVNFHFQPGDYVYVNVPSISSEWHPFTISSAPELPDFFSLHIRAVGGWTRKLFNYFNRDLSQLTAGEHTFNKNAKFPFNESLEEILISGPYGAPSNHIFHASHAVLIATGIGVTPFASILQSIMSRYYANQHTSIKHTAMNLKKVDFIWINRDQKSFEWFTQLLSRLEIEQAENQDGPLGQFLNLHMYITSALNKSDMKAVGLQMALDLLYAKEKRDLLTGLKTRTKAGRPNWDRVFQRLKDESVEAGGREVSVFYCGNPQLAKSLRKKCDQFEFNFRKEIF